MKLSEKITAVIKEIDSLKEDINGYYNIARHRCNVYSDRAYFNFDAKIAETKLAALEELLDELITQIKE
jgi:hypothetical protein